MRRKHVVTLAYDGLTTFEFAVSVELFGRARPEFEGWYTHAVIAVEPPPLRAEGGIEINALHDLAQLERADVIVIPGWRSLTEHPGPELCYALRQANARGARLVSICSGVFVLAAAGLLDGLHATTHWQYVDELRRQYPELIVEPDVLYTESGNVLTSAGSAAGIDLCLHLIRTDFGSQVANTVARRMVVPPHRDGGQAQYIQQPMPPADGSGLAELCDWMRAHLTQPLTVNSLAKRAHMSPRTFARQFQRSAGLSPHRWLLRERVRQSRTLLETTDLSIERVAEQVGFGSAQLLRHHFRRETDTTPSAYRATFGAG